MGTRLGPKYILHSYMDPLGQASGVRLRRSSHAHPGLDASRRPPNFKSTDPTSN